MAIGVTMIIVAAVVVAIWILIEIKRMKHKIFAIFLIALILFTYISFTASIKNKDIDLKTMSGITDAGKLYFSWLGNAFGNIKDVTVYAIKQNWSEVNESVLENKNETFLDKL